MVTLIAAIESLRAVVRPLTDLTIDLLFLWHLVGLFRRR
jgi:hypothetical protein